MKKVATVFVILLFFTIPVNAAELTPPEPPPSAEVYLPDNIDNFWEDLLSILIKAFENLQPAMVEAVGICVSLIALCVLISMLQGVTGGAKRVTELSATIGFSFVLLQPANAMIRAGTNVIEEMAEYGKQLLPVMTTALAAQGATSTSAALYIGTTVFLNMLTSVISKFIVPMIYVYICLCIADRALETEVLKSLKHFLKWLMTWSLKIVIYVFTGYVSVTGIVSGTVDASTIKAAKLAISGVVPVVGGIISDASESVIVGAAVMKNSVGIYGLLVILSLLISPFLQIGLQYLMLKITDGVCSVFGSKSATGIISDISVAMGFVLGMIGTVSLMLLISTVCFMKGIS